MRENAVSVRTRRVNGLLFSKTVVAEPEVQYRRNQKVAATERKGRTCIVSDRPITGSHPVIGRSLFWCHRNPHLHYAESMVNDASIVKRDSRPSGKVRYKQDKI